MLWVSVVDRGSRFGDGSRDVKFEFRMMFVFVCGDM